MKIIDLFRKIANGEEAPMKFKYDNHIFIFDDKTNDYIYADGNVSFFTDYFSYIYHLEDILMLLNDEIEIIEEKEKIEELNLNHGYYLPSKEFVEDYEFKKFVLDELFAQYDKINELVKAVNELRKEK
ncbi:MAG: hypothetical protein IJ501_06630 [Bacilli bacterium]|nr:hypothetical protein [Bacilli bacterium]